MWPWKSFLHDYCNFTKVLKYLSNTQYPRSLALLLSHFKYKHNAIKRFKTGSCRKEKNTIRKWHNIELFSSLPWLLFPWEWGALYQILVPGLGIGLAGPYSVVGRRTWSLAVGLTPCCLRFAFMLSLIPALNNSATAMVIVFMVSPPLPKTRESIAYQF